MYVVLLVIQYQIGLTSYVVNIVLVLLILLLRVQKFVLVLCSSKKIKQLLGNILRNHEY